MEQEPIRVLFADDSPTIRSFLFQLLSREVGIEVVGQATTGHEAVRIATEMQPDIVLMDIHMPGLDGIQAAWLVSNRVPHGAVIMATSEQRPDFMAKAVAAGAKGYVLKPFGGGTQLLEKIREVHGEAIERRKAFAQGDGDASVPGPSVGRTIAVVGSKGGVGKTTLAVNLALALQQQASTVLMDADFMFGDLMLHVDASSNHSIVDLVPFENALDSSVVSQVIEKHASGLHVLPRPTRPEQAEIITADLVRSIVSVLNSLYGFSVIDTQLSYDERMLAILDDADVFLVVLSAQLGALRNTRHFLDVAGILGYPEDRMRFVLNRSDALNGFTLEDVISVVETRRIWQIPSGGSALTESVNLGAPLSMTAPDSPYAKAIAGLADHVRLLASDKHSRAMDS